MYLEYYSIEEERLSLAIRKPRIKTIFAQIMSLVNEYEIKKWSKDQKRLPLVM